jgi:hypothetical protein
MNSTPLQPRGPLPPNLDTDRFIQIVLDEVAAAAQGWKNGDPRDETAFMSRLTERLKRRRRNCDVGKATPMRVDSSTYVLHRKGTKQTDKYGADLAVTLDVNREWRKTVIFQLKKSNRYKVGLDNDDLKAALEDPLIAERSFVLAVDEDRLGIRIEKVEKLNAKLQGSGQQSMTFDTNTWRFLHEWLDEWLRCELAPPSPTDGSPGVEGMLESFRVDPIEDEYEISYEPSEVSHLESVTARAWLTAYAHKLKPE